MPVLSGKRFSRDDGYGRSTRFYETPDGLKLPSVTSILSVVAKPALVNWAANEERKACVEAATEVYERALKLPKPPSVGSFAATLASQLATTKAHIKVLAKAADIGSAAHAMIEWTLRTELLQKVSPEPALSEAALWAYMAWEDWRKKANLVPLAVEQTVWHAGIGYAGTMDLFCELDIPGGGRGKVVVDWKTGKAIYGESRLQNAAYTEAMIALGHAERPVWGLIVRLPKVSTDPEFETRWISPQEQTEYFRAFCHAVDLWKWQDQQVERRA